MEENITHKPYYDHAGVTIYEGHILTVLESMKSESIQMCVTSPPYWGLRDYGLEPQIWDAIDECEHRFQLESIKVAIQKGGNWQQAKNGPELLHGRHQTRFKGNTKEAGKQIFKEINIGFCQLCGAWCGSLGLEPTPELYVDHLVQVFRGVKRVLRKDGTLWLNLGDSYASGKGDCFNPGGGENSLGILRKEAGVHPLSRGNVSELKKSGLKPKDLCMIPARVALALQADGWWLRSAMPWVKRSAMPESQSDRPTSALEYMFLLTKSAKCYFDMEAIKIKTGDNTHSKGKKLNPPIESAGIGHVDWHKKTPDVLPTRNFRNTDLFFESIKEPHGMIFCGDEMVGIDVNPKGYKKAHFATFPPKLIEPCIKAGTSEHGCCSECGSPWERVVEKPPMMQVDESELDRYGNGTAGIHRKVGQKYQNWREQNPDKTLGWQPTCKCFGVSAEQTAWDVQMGLEEYNPIPCVVLDPFGGSMTTAYVAKELGRKAVMIDLSKEYIEMGIDRLKQGVFQWKNA